MVLFNMQRTIRAVLFIVASLILSNLTIIQPCIVQATIPTPTHPAIYIQLNDLGYIVSYERWLTVYIGPSQTFTPYTDSEEHQIDLYYNVRWKNHQDNTWKSLDQTLEQYFGGKTYYLPHDSGTNNRPADRVTLSFGINGYDTSASYAGVVVPNVEELDFQAEAIIGYYTEDCVLIGNSSGWSNIVVYNMNQQSNTIIPDTVCSSSTLGNSPAQNDYGLKLMAGLFLLAIGVTVAVVLFIFKKTIRP